MPTNILIQVPNNMFQYHKHLRKFFEGMIQKLEANVHKDTPNVGNIPDLIAKCLGEMHEFLDQFEKDVNDENSLIELMDVANFAFLTYVALRLQGVEHAETSGRPNSG